MRLYTSNMLQQGQINKIDAQVSLDFPSKIYFDMTPDCNLCCIMCRDAIENSGRIMKFELFKRIVDEICEGVTSYSLFNSGESLLLRDFKDRVEYVSKRKLSNATIDLSTNGMLLTEDLSKYLIDYDVEVSISFDGSNAEIFEHIRRGSNFKIICRNIERIAAIASQMEPFRAPGIGISIQKDNWEDLANIISVGNELGVKRVSMWPVIGPEECRLIPSKSVVEKITEAINSAEDKGMAVDLYPTRLGEYIWNGEKYTNFDNFLVDTKCNAPFTNIGIDWEGEVYLCCNHGSNVENINEKSFRDVWRGKNYQRLRMQVNDDKTMPARCRHCFWVNRY